MIVAKNLTCSYDEPVIKGANFEIMPGEITALIGVNGSGKSTLAQVLTGLKAFKGEIHIDDFRLGRHSSAKELRRHVGLVFQNPDHQILFSRVREDLEFILHNLGWPKAEYDTMIKQALAAVGLEGFEEANPHDLSGGQKQRLAIASALVTHPDYLILDEATSMLDAENRQAIYQILAKLANTGTGILMITNLLDELLLADQVLILHNRKIQKYHKRDLLEHLEILEHAGLRVPFVLRLAQKQQAYTWPELEKCLEGV